MLKIQEILKTQSTLIPVDPESLADHFLAVYEGALILARTWNDPKIVYVQLTHFQTYLELLFQPVDEED